jgi:hypothetical protein
MTYGEPIIDFTSVSVTPDVAFDIFDEINPWTDGGGS